MTEAQLIDLHQDLLPHIEARDRFGSVFQTDWEQLEESPIRIVVASTFPGYRFDDFMSKESARYSLSLMQRYQDDCTSRSGWHLVLKAKDLDRALTTPSRGIVIHVEGIGAYPGSIEKLTRGAGGKPGVDPSARCGTSETDSPPVPKTPRLASLSKENGPLHGLIGMPWCWTSPT